MDFNIKLRNGQVLKGIIQSPGENTKAVIVLVHGLGEHIQRYNQWSDRFKAEGFAFVGVDLPGHGRSGGRRGYIKSYQLLSEMIDILLKTVQNTFPGLPVYLYGHSMGGGIVLDYLIRKNPKIQGAIVTSPWIRLSFQPARIKLLMASVLKHILPGLVQSSGLVVSDLSHNGTISDAYEKDPLVHGRISVSLFVSTMNAGEHSLKHASELKVPTLLLHGSDDRICSPQASREFASKSPMVDLKIWDGGYHELHNEPFKDEVFRFIMSWLRRPNPRSKQEQK
jgi:alpha-beta hydrolase superfamily lysophospholipase